MADIPLNRGSDLRFVGTYRDDSGEPVDFTGWSISVFEPTAGASGLATEWTDAAAGAFEASMPWVNTIPEGRLTNFRLRLSRGNDELTSPLIWIHVQ